MMRYKAVLFDMDGTVLDTLRDLNAAVNETLEHFGYHAQTLEETRRYVGNGSRRLIELSLPFGSGDDEIDRVLDWYLPYYNAHANDTTAPYRGIPELLETLRVAGYGLAVVSNKPDRTVKQLAGIYFGEQLQTAVGENERGGIRRKPAPDTVLAAAGMLGAAAGECLYVGDSEVDIITAANAGMDCASVLWGFRTREELEAAGASMLFETPRELTDYLIG